MKKNDKAAVYRKRGRGSGRRDGMQRFSGVPYKALRLLDEVGKACDAWLELHEDRPPGWDSFRYGKGVKK